MARSGRRPHPGALYRRAFELQAGYSLTAASPVDAVDRLDQVERHQYDPPPGTEPATGVLVGGSWYATGDVGPAQQAWSDYERIRREVVAALSGEASTPARRAGDPGGGTPTIRSSHDRRGTGTGS